MVRGIADSAVAPFPPHHVHILFRLADDMVGGMMPEALAGWTGGGGGRGMERERLVHRNFYNKFGDNFDDEDLD